MVKRFLTLASGWASILFQIFVVNHVKVIVCYNLCFRWQLKHGLFLGENMHKWCTTIKQLDYELKISITDS